jgi:hypothetical protein
MGKDEDASGGDEATPQERPAEDEAAPDPAPPPSSDSTVVPKRGRWRWSGISKGPRYLN